MNETELERLIVRLVGDASSYLKMLKDAADATKKNAEDMSNQSKKMADGFKEAGHALEGALIGLGAKKFLEESLHAWEEQEDAVIKLEAVLQANGRDVQALSKDYQEWSSAMQDVSTTADEMWTSMLKQAETFKVTGGLAKEAVKNAAALAEINDSSAQAMIRITAAMAKGDTDTAMMFSRMIPQLRGIKDEAEFTARYEALVAAGMDVMAKKSETAGGRLTQLKNDFGDFQEQIGKIVAEGIAPLAHQLSGLAKWLQTLPDFVKTATVAIIALGVGMATVATTAPWLIAQIKGITVATRELTVAAMANPYVWAVIALVAVRQLNELVIEQTGHMQRLNSAKEESVKLDDKLTKSTKTKYDRMIQDAKNEGAEGIKSVTERLKRELEGSKKKLEEAKEMAVPEWGTPIVGLFFPSVTEGLAKERGAAVEEAQKFVDLYEAMLGRLKEAEDKRKESKSQLNVLYEIGEAASKEAIKIKQANEELMKSWDQEAHTVGMTSREIKIYEEIMKGATDETIRAMQERDEWIGRVEDDFKIANEAKALAESLMTPDKKLAQRMQELEVMIRKGKLTWDEYADAVEKAHREILGIQAASRDAAAFGTGEAATRIEDYLNVITKRSRLDPRVPQDFMGGAKGFGRGAPPKDDEIRDKGVIWIPETLGENKGGIWEGIGGARGGPGPDKLDKTNDLLGAVKDALLGMAGIKLGKANIGG